MLLLFSRYLWYHSKIRGLPYEILCIPVLKGLQNCHRSKLKVKRKENKMLDFLGPASLISGNFCSPLSHNYEQRCIWKSSHFLKFIVSSQERKSDSSIQSFIHLNLVQKNILASEILGIKHYVLLLDDNAFTFFLFFYRWYLGNYIGTCYLQCSALASPLSYYYQVLLVVFKLWLVYY